METYTETVYRYVVEYHEELPEQHKAEMRLNGIDPDERWCLKWSFLTLEDANAQMESDIELDKEICKKFDIESHTTYRVRDLGETKHIERTAWI